MTLEALGNVGDFLGGIAVIVSLLYLAAQIRRNTLTVQAAAIQSASQALSEFMELIASDAELVNLFEEGCRDFEALSMAERQRFSALMGAIMHRFENILAQTRRGFLPANEWEGARNRLRGTFERPRTLVWWERGRHAFNPELRGWVESQLISQPSR